MALSMNSGRSVIADRTAQMQVAAGFDQGFAALGDGGEIRIARIGIEFFRQGRVRLLCVERGLSTFLLLKFGHGLLRLKAFAEVNFGECLGQYTQILQGFVETILSTLEM